MAASGHRRNGHRRFSRTHTLGQRLTEQDARLTAGDQDELRRMAQEQARSTTNIERIEQEDRPRRQLLGLDQTAEEMKQVEEALRQGQLGDEVEQKQRHLSRMLDAQRSVNRQDFEPRRESRPGEDTGRSAHRQALPAELLRERPAAARPAQDPGRPLSVRVPRISVEAYLRALNHGTGRAHMLSGGLRTMARIARRRRADGRARRACRARRRADVRLDWRPMAHPLTSRRASTASGRSLQIRRRVRTDRTGSGKPAPPTPALSPTQATRLRQAQTLRANGQMNRPAPRWRRSLPESRTTQPW